MKNSTTQNHNIDDMQIFKIAANKIYENCELTGFKILSDEGYIRDNFGKEIADMFIEYPEGVKNDRDTAEEYLQNIVKIDAIQYEINQQLGGTIDTSKKLNFELLMTDKNGKEHSVKFENFQLGINDTTKGFPHLLMQAKSIDGNERSILKSTSRLDDICKVPSQLLKDKIASKSHDIVRSLGNVTPKEISPEMSAFLKQFVDKFLDSDKQRTRKDFINEMEREKKKREEKKEKSDLKDNAKEEVANGFENPQKQIVTADIDNIQAKRYEKDKEPQHIKDFKSDIKKFQDYEKKYNEIISAENSLSANDKKEQINKLEKESGVSVAEFMGLKQEQDEFRKAAIKSQSQKKSLNNEQVTTKETLQEKSSPAEPKSQRQTKLDAYDDFYLNAFNPKADGYKYYEGHKPDVKAKFYTENTEPKYIKDFKSNINKLNDYEKEFKNIYDSNGKAKHDPKIMLEKTKNLEQNYKISVSEFLGIKTEQVTKRLDAIKFVKDNDLAKTSKSKEQIRTNQPTDRGL